MDDSQTDIGCQHWDSGKSTKADVSLNFLLSDYMLESVGTMRLSWENKNTGWGLSLRVIKFTWDLAVKNSRHGVQCLKKCTSPPSPAPPIMGPTPQLHASKWLKPAEIQSILLVRSVKHGSVVLLPDSDYFLCQRNYLKEKAYPKNGNFCTLPYDWDQSFVGEKFETPNLKSQNVFPSEMFHSNITSQLKEVVDA